MKITLTRGEVEDIIKVHLESKGFKVNNIGVQTEEITNYKYDGDYLHETRTPYQKECFVGVAAEVEQ